jgi:succinyl-diaminopimelate desuccinylase
MAAEIVELTKALVSFKTTDGNLFELDRCINFIKNYFSGCNVVIKKFVCNKKPSLVVTLHKTRKPELFLVGHIDVVPAKDRDFVPVVKKGKLFGRGSCDNKASVAAMMHLVREFSGEKKKPSLGMIITSDEEIGGEDGIRFLLKKQGYRSRFVVVPDGGGIDELVTKEKGFLRLKISALGKAAHSAHLWEGENAIEKLMAAYWKIKKLFPKTTARNRWKTTVNLGKISGGNAVNVVPNRAEMELDVRYTERDSKEKIIKKIGKVKGVEVELLQHGLMFKTDKNNAYAAALKKAMQKALKKRVVFSVEHGASDIRFFSEYNVPGVLFMPKGGNIHAENEYVDIKSLKKFYFVLKEFINKNVTNK